MRDGEGFWMDEFFFPSLFQLFEKPEPYIVNDEEDYKGEVGILEKGEKVPCRAKEFPLGERRSHKRRKKRRIIAMPS